MEIFGAKKIQGEIAVPGDKSISHRSALISSITNDDVFVENFLFSQDCISTLEVLKKLGVSIKKLHNGIIIKGRGVEGLKEPDDVLYVGNSGTTIRLLPGILSATDFLSVLSGDSSINNRPMGRIIKPLTEMGLNICGRDVNRKPPLTIFGTGKKLQGKKFNIDVSSAQVKSCIMLAGINANGSTEIKQPYESRDHTERMLEYFGMDVKYDGKNTVIKGGTRLKGKNLFVPGDISSAAYFIIAALILKDSKILIKNVGLNPTRTYFLELLKKMGGNINIIDRRLVNNEPIGNIEVSHSELNGINIDKEVIPNIIDEIPILCVAASLARGKTDISGALELRYKESDRISTICNEFSKLGVSINEKKDGMTINGNKGLKPKGTEVSSHNDHRIAMSLAILSLLTEDSVNIIGSECIETSFPGFRYLLKNNLS